MELTHSFTVPLPVGEAWSVLTDIERVAPCMPGASLDHIDGDEFAGRVKVKVGPVQMTYKGKAHFSRKDAAERVAVIVAEGSEVRGSGTAAATVTARLSDAGDATRVDVVTELAVTGRPAQFGRGVLADVGEQLLGRFADSLRERLQDGEETAATPPAPATAPVPQSSAAAAGPPAAAAAALPADDAEREPSWADVPALELDKVLLPVLLKRIKPLLALVAALLAWRIARRRRA